MNDPVLHLSQRLEALAPYIGNTPLWPLRRAYARPGVAIHAKLEWQQLGGSVKARAAYRMLREAIQTGAYQPGQTLLDSTSGNTGIALAMLAAQIGIPITLIMPEDASVERKRILAALGVEMCYTPAELSSDEVFAFAQDMHARNPDRFCYLNQYDNSANWQAHYHGTAREIYEQTQGQVTHLATGLGTCGTFVGTGRRLREWNAGIQLVALHPDVKDNGIKGWKHLDSSRHPAIYDPQLADAHLKVTTEEAHFWMKQAARKEGLLLSPSAGAALAGAVKLADRLERGVVVTVFPDDASKYGALLQSLFT
ncbi:MAG: cysteine synthase family protein [Bacteroidetes bacterium]|nr:MAG: cysteine synthase family protein [Bacteroidota bacterium]